MKTYIDCIPCFVEHGVHLAKRVSSAPAMVDAMVSQVLRELLSHKQETPPPLMARKINSIIRDMASAYDPYLEEKDLSTHFALELLEVIRPDLELQPDRFEALVRLAIAGNIIDFGVDKTFKLESARARILEAFHLKIDQDAVLKLRRSMERAKGILYIADNCGEAVFDRLLIEGFKEKITLAVRGYPILNDLTRRELAASGLENLAAAVVDTGDFTPGISFDHSSQIFLDAFEKADLIIAKGQGNYETLSDSRRPVFFLFRAKCKVVTEALGGVTMGSFQVIPSNIPKYLTHEEPA